MLTTTTQFIKSAWLKTITTIENVKNFRIKEYLSMLFTVNVVLGLIREPYSIKEYLTKRMEQQIFAGNKFQREARHLNSRQ